MKSKITLIAVCALLIGGTVVAVHLEPWKKKEIQVTEAPYISKFIKDCADKERVTVEKYQEYLELGKLGFTRFAHLAREKEKIASYDRKYAGYTFVSDDVVNQILQKYRLAVGDIGTYTCDVPKVNRDKIAEFLLKYPLDSASARLLTSQFDVVRTGQDEAVGRSEMVSPADRGGSRSLKIIALRSCFHQGNVIAGFDEDGNPIRDPIVLYPVEEGFIIVTSW